LRAWINRWRTRINSANSAPTKPRETPLSAQTESRPSIISNSTSWLERLWSSIADRGRDYANVPAASLPLGERARRLAEALLSGGGEASGAALARELVTAFKALPPGERLAFCRHIAAGFTPDEAA